jgi:hypothetical protein
MTRIFAGVTALLIAGFASPASAQNDSKTDISAGYQWLSAKASSENESRTFPAGWYVDTAGHVTPLLSIVGQVSGNYRTFDDEGFDLAIHTFMAGIRASSQGRIRGYGQFLAGGASLKASDAVASDSETDLALQLGGGLTVPATARIGLRLGVDYVRIFAKEDGAVLGEDVNGFRFIVGAVFGLGGP